MTNDFLKYLKEKISPQIEYAQTPFQQQTGCPEAKGAYFIKETEEIIAFTKAFMKLQVRLQNRRKTLGNRVRIVPTTEEYLQACLDFVKE